MKFRDPKTGEVFEGIWSALNRFCLRHTCENCVLPADCCKCVSDYPDRAALLMGLEEVEDKAVEGMCCDCVEDGPCCDWNENESYPSRKEDGSCWRPFTEKEAPMERVAKPRICRVLGVEVGEVFSVRADTGELRQFMVHGIRLHHVREDGSMGNRANNMTLWLVEHPDRIIRKPRFTVEEVALLRTLHAAGARYLARGDKHLRWYSRKPYQRAEDNKWDMRGDWGTMSGKLPAKLFPSLHPGQSIKLEEIIGQKENRPG